MRRLLRVFRIPFRTSGKGLPGTPDVVNKDEKWAIFVHGCFWHRHKGCKRATTPNTNRAFWLRKFQLNLERDKRKINDLKTLGYQVLVIWECQLEDPGRVARRLTRQLPRKKAGALPSSSRVSHRLAASGKRVVRLVRTGKRGAVVNWLPVPNGLVGDPATLFDQALLRRATTPTLSSRGEAVRVVDLFSGCGGLSLGAREASRAIGRPFEVVLAIDASQTSLGVYKENFHPNLAYACDIQSVLDGQTGSTPTRKEVLLRKLVGRVDLLLAGPPCQGHSDLNNHTRRTDERNKLYERVGRFAEIVRPRSILVENVRTIVHSRDRSLKQTMDLLRALGYTVDASIVDASELGVPQVRRRHVLLASLDKRVTVGDVVSRHRVSTIRTVRWAIEDLSRERRDGIFTRPTRHTEENRRRMEFLGANRRLNLPNRLRPPCHRDGGHTYKSMYGRLSYDLPAATITGGFGSPGQGRFIHPTQCRTLTPHEAARLQCFPDWFKFSGVMSRTALAEMIGNAVPMKLSYAFCLELLL